MSKAKIMNVPNVLSIIRVCLVPVFVVTLLFMRNVAVWGLVVPAIVYALTAFTDMLDGKIARKYGLVTDFGKFIDPLADKFMVIGSAFSILANMFLTGEATEGLVFVWLVLLILFRELGVTSLRLVVAGGKKKVDLAANMFGKLKTVSQMVGTVLIILEPLIFPFAKENHIVAYVCMAIIAVTTIGSGWNYFVAYLPYITGTDEQSEPAPEAQNPEAPVNGEAEAQNPEAPTNGEAEA
jgi:CDP-diacylglycerol--glycerol-3-phosphate 3-phosphatidyltransferase